MRHASSPLLSPAQIRAKTDMLLESVGLGPKEQAEPQVAVAASAGAAAVADNANAHSVGSYGQNEKVRALT